MSYVLSMSIHNKIPVQKCVRWPGIIGANLSEPHTSVTALCMHVCMLVCLFGPTTYHKFKSAHSNIHDEWIMLMCTSAKPWEPTWRATTKLKSRGEREWERRLFKLNALAACTATYFLNHGTSLMIAWQGRLRQWQLDSRVYTGFRCTSGMTAHT